MNAGARLNSIFTAALTAKDAQAMSFAALWAAVFDVPLTGEVQRDVAPCLLALSGEIDAVRAALVADGATDAMLEPAFLRLKQAIEFSRFGSPWKDFVGNLQSPEVRCTLAWVAWAMPDDEDSLEPEALQTMLKDIEALETSAQAAGVSPYMRHLALDSAAMLRGALRAYGIQGGKALSKALTEAVGKVAREGGVIQAETANGTAETRTVYERIKSVFSKLSDAAAVVEKGNKMIESGKTVYRHGKDIFDAIMQLPPPGGAPGA
jgi:hypothetical protein